MIERTLNTPLLGVIPSAALSGWSRGSELSPPKRPKRLTDGVSIIATHDAATIAPGASNTAFAESLRSLRTALLLSRGSAPPKVILVTSAAEGEGKSTISLHLAAALARNHSKVLLVEGDMRCRSMARRVSVSDERGLSNLLSEDGPIERIEVRPFADMPNLAILLAGPTPPYPAELLGSRRMKELIKKWSHEYDFVLIDSPSLLAVTDAVILSKMADFTLLVTRHAQSARKGVERAWRILRIDPETRVGVVLNAVSRGSAAYGEYFGSYGNSYYGKMKGGAHA